MSDQLFHKKRIKSEENLRRRDAMREENLTILIVGEGTTEYNYFNDLKRKYRGKGINIILEKPRGSAPINIVDCAINYCEANDGIEYAFCVFDKDEHSRFHKAIDKLQNYKPSPSAKSCPIYKSIISIPCFEIWILLHFTFTTKGYAKTGNKSASEILHDELIKVFPDYTKTTKNLFSELLPRLLSAKQNALKLISHNYQTKTTNPSTNVHELIEFIFKIIDLDVT